MLFTLILAMGELLAAESRSEGVRAGSPAIVLDRESVPPFVVEPSEQLTNPKTGVTCTMRILRARPDVDPQVADPSPRTSVDPAIRGNVSPCLE